MATDYLVSIVTKATDGITPALKQQGATVDQFLQKLNQAGQTGASSLDPVANGIAKVGREAEAASKSVERFADSVRKPGTLQPTIPAARFGEFNRRQDELQRLTGDISGRVLPASGMTSLLRDIAGAQTFKDIDRLGERIQLLIAKSEALAGKGGKSFDVFRQSIMRATSTGEVEKLVAGIGKVEEKAHKAGFSLHNLGAKLKEVVESRVGGGALGGGIIGGIIGGALVAGVNLAIQALHKLSEALTDTIKHAHELAMEQRQLHIESIETGLSVHALETLKTASKLTGVEIGTLQFGMRRLAQQVVEHPEVFEKAGIAVRDLATGAFLPLEQVMGQLGDVMKQSNSQVLQMALTTTIMGRSGTRLLPVLLEGTAGMKRWGEAGLRAGTIMDSLSDQVLVNLANQTARTSVAWEGFHNRLAVAIAPFLNAASAAMERFIGIATPFAAVLQGLATGAIRLAPGIGIMAGDFKNVQTEAGHVVGHMSALSAHQVAANEKLQKMLNSFKGIVSESEKFEERMTKLVGTLRAVTPTAAVIDNMALGFRGTTAEIRELGRAFDDDVIKKIAARAPIVQAAAKGFGDAWRLALESLGNDFSKFSENAKIAIEAIGTAAPFDDIESKVNAVREALLRANVIPGWDAALKRVTEEIGKITDSSEALRTALLRANTLTSWQEALVRVNNGLKTGELSLQEWRFLTSEISEQINKIPRVVEIEFKVKPPKIPTLKPDEKVPQTEPQAFPEDARRPFTADIQEDLRKMADAAFNMRDMVIDAAKSMSGAMSDFWGDMVDQAIETKSFWGKFWNQMVKIVLDALFKMISAKVALAVVDFLTTLAGGGPGPASAGSALKGTARAPQAPNKAEAAPPRAPTRATTAPTPRVAPTRVDTRPPAPIRVQMPLAGLQAALTRAVAPRTEPTLIRALRNFDAAITRQARMQSAADQPTLPEREPPREQTDQRQAPAPIDMCPNQVFNINAIDMRSMIEDILNPRGALRNANKRLNEIAEVYG